MNIFKLEYFEPEYDQKVVKNGKFFKNLVNLLIEMRSSSIYLQKAFLSVFNLKFIFPFL